MFVVDEELDLSSLHDLEGEVYSLRLLSSAAGTDVSQCFQRSVPSVPGRRF